MCNVPKPSAPTPLTPPADPPKQTDPAVTRARQSERQRAAIAGGRQGTILTRPDAMDPANTTKKTLLGQ